ncbi:class I SAM-dependent methyltransferase [Mariniphaga sediminis]|uniref:class I SAM-dependent methyltransferase n=1 Tax=Mariniphaga sediminis TaxID=1628158 RepID=UPI0035685E7D
MNKKLLEILDCNHCHKGSLRMPSGNDELICTNCNQKYDIANNVPLLLQYTEPEEQPATELHKNQGTLFNYIEHYQKDAKVYDYFSERDSGTEHGDRRVREYIASQIPLKKGRILDVGCGKAWVARDFCPQGFEVTSMDISLENTSEALKRYPFENHSAVVADAYSPPFKKNSFDYIIASEIIEHVAYPDNFVKSLFQILKPGGVLIVTTPYKEKIRYSLCVHCNKPTPFNAHLHSFDEKILTSLYTEPDLKQCHYQTFGNKILIHLRLHVILKYLNFKVWKILDRIMNKVYNVPLRILVKWEKIQ